MGNTCSRLIVLVPGTRCELVTGMFTNPGPSGLRMRPWHRLFLSSAAAQVPVPLESPRVGASVSQELVCRVQRCCFPRPPRPVLPPIVIDNSHTDKALCYLLEPLAWGQCERLRTLLLVLLVALVLVSIVNVLLISCMASLYARVLHCYMILVDGALQGRVFVRPQQ